MDNEEDTLIAVVQASKFQSSVKITIPKRIVEELLVEHGTFVGFYKSAGRVYIKKVK